jgi:type I restriction-modification system DNA methylase subunit
MSKYTPDDIADIMAQWLELKPSHSLLEPSAGDGQLIRACRRVCAGKKVDYYELDTKVSFRLFVDTTDSVFRGNDFMEDGVPMYDRIIANPPFENDVWSKHLKKMYDSLAPTGILVCIIPRESIINDGEGYKKFQNTIRGLASGNIPLIKLESKSIDNWYTNSNGTITPIVIIKMTKL